VYVCMCVCVYVCMCMCSVHVCMCVCACIYICWYTPTIKGFNEPGCQKLVFVNDSARDMELGRQASRDRDLGKHRLRHYMYSMYTQLLFTQQ